MISKLSDETLKLKIRTLRELGLPDDHIVLAFRRFSHIFSLVAETMKLKLRTLREVGSRRGL